VLPSAQGTGLADLMMERLVGTEPASLWVLDGNVRAEAFYRRHGFARDGAEKQHPPTGTTEVRMVRGQHP
jgi:GNAT superfamily N-acetyltransferase